MLKSCCIGFSKYFGVCSKQIIICCYPKRGERGCKCVWQREGERVENGRDRKNVCIWFVWLYLICIIYIYVCLRLFISVCVSMWAHLKALNVMYPCPKNTVSVGILPCSAGVCQNKCTLNLSLFFCCSPSFFSPLCPLPHCCLECWHLHQRRKNLSLQELCKRRLLYFNKTLTMLLLLPPAPFKFRSSARWRSGWRSLLWLAIFLQKMTQRTSKA